VLTPQDLALRTRGIGASEVAAILELDPYKGPIDVWLRKATPTRGPLLPPSPPSPAAEMGHAIEPVIRQLYMERTGIEVKPTATTVHPDFAFVLATADGLGEQSGLEIKLVGANMAHHWGDAGDPAGVPDYVITQTAQNMAVFDRDRWDVCALVGGTDLRLWTIERDADLEASLIEAQADFWERYVLGDEAPPMPDVGSRREYMRKRYPGSTKTRARQLGAEEELEIAVLVEQLVAAKGDVLTIAERIDALEAQLCGVVGADYGIEGSFGKFLWIPMRGRVDWKAVAEDLAGGEGKVPTLLMEKHRGEGSRQVRFYPPKNGATRR